MSTETLRRSSPTGRTIDPRLAARRAAVVRNEGRRRLRRLLVLLALATAALGVTAVLRSSLLDVDHVTISGTGRTSSTVARRSTGINLGRAMISVDPAAAEARLERLPWVARASVQRHWPATVAVRIVERRPVAVVSRTGITRVLDRTGRVLGPATASDLARLPHVAGDVPGVGGAVGPARRRVTAILRALTPDLRAQVATARVGSAGTILTLRDDITVRWGGTQLAHAKIEALRTILTQVQRSDIASIDVTVPTAAAITSKTGSDR